MDAVVIFGAIAGILGAGGVGVALISWARGKGKDRSEVAQVEVMTADAVTNIAKKLLEDQGRIYEEQVEGLKEQVRRVLANAEEDLQRMRERYDERVQRLELQLAEAQRMLAEMETRLDVEQRKVEKLEWWARSNAEVVRRLGGTPVRFDDYPG